MSLESRFSQDKRVIFRENFTPESIAKNGGQVTGGVSLNDGVATFDGTGYITYPRKSLGKQTILIRFKTTNTTLQGILGFLPGNLGFIFKYNALGCILYLGTTNFRYFDQLDSYCDGEWHLMEIYIDGKEQVDINNATLKIDGVAIPIAITNATGTANSWITFDIGRTGAWAKFEGSIDLLEIYSNTHLTDEESTLLYKNKLYTGFTQENCVLFADYTKGTSLNWKNPAGIHTDTGVVYKHGLGANFEQNTSEVNYASPNIFDVNTGDLTLEIVVIPVLDSLVAHQAIVGKGFFSAGDTGFGLAVLGIGTANFYGEMSNGASTSSCVTAWDYKAGVTYHIVIVRDISDGANGSFKMYINGVLDNTTNDALKGISLTDVTEDFVVGNRSDGHFDYYGLVKYVRFYKGIALTPEQITQNHQYARQKFGCL